MNSLFDEETFSCFWTVWFSIVSIQSRKFGLHPCQGSNRSGGRVFLLLGGVLLCSRGLLVSAWAKWNPTISISAHHVHTDVYLFLFEVTSHAWTSVYSLTTETGRSLNHHCTKPLRGRGRFLHTSDALDWFWHQSTRIGSDSTALVLTAEYKPVLKLVPTIITNFCSRNLQGLFYCRGPLTFAKFWTEVIF